MGQRSADVGHPGGDRRGGGEGQGEGESAGGREGVEEKEEEGIEKDEEGRRRLSHCSDKCNTRACLTMLYEGGRVTPLSNQEGFTYLSLSLRLQSITGLVVVRTMT